MIYCEVLLSTSTRGRELKSKMRQCQHFDRWSTSTRGRELKNRRRVIAGKENRSTSTRGRELKNAMIAELFEREFVDLHERS